MRWVGLLALAAATRVAMATPPEPTGPHPRMLLDRELRAAWKALATDEHSAIARAIARCDRARTTHDHDGAQYQGWEWAKTLQACLVAWAATDRLEHRATALRFFVALLDDLDTLGDGKGGDAAATRDGGYAIRNLGPYTALAYDWLYDAPGMTPALRQHARERWASWLDWYAAKGYRRRDPATNYQAGFLLAATMIAIAQGGDAAEQNGLARWKFVADELWGNDMAAALAPGGLLDGGDWPEGWGYGPLSVAEYALAARVAKRAGIAVDGAAPWLASVLRRHVYGLSPGGGVWPGGDTDFARGNMEPNQLTLQAVALGDAADDDKRYANGEFRRLGFEPEPLLYDALAAVGGSAQPVPRASWATWYRTGATATLFARTRWDERAVWFVAECARSLKADHRVPNAGNFALSRGRDDVIVDPSPEGSLSTLTTNAPTVASARLPGPYQPSQGVWANDTRWEWATQTRGGVVAARCNYADSFTFQDRASDIDEAVRDFVLLPSADGTDATLVVVDRARTGDAARNMFLRFRVPGQLAQQGPNAIATIGATKLAIHGAAPARIAAPTAKDCFKPGIERGKCDAARFPVTDYRVEIAGPNPRAVHVIDATAANAATGTEPISGETWAGIQVKGLRDAIVVWPTKPGTAIRYKARRGDAVTHVVLSDKSAITAVADGDDCAVSVSAGGSEANGPAIATLDRSCRVTADPESPSASSAIGTRPATVRSQANRRGGCCDAGGDPSAAIAALFALFALRRGRDQAP